MVGGSVQVLALLVTGFFFSSRRRHTRSKRDWSSDVCSSDLGWVYKRAIAGDADDDISVERACGLDIALEDIIFTSTVARDFLFLAPKGDFVILFRSEERRVGKECRVLCWREE